LYDLSGIGLIKVSKASSEKKVVTSVKQTESSYRRVMSEKEQEEHAMEQMFAKARKVDLSEDEKEVRPKVHTDVGYNDDDWA
jgi:hypothetical protein